MKRILFISVLFTMLMSLTSLHAFAENSTSRSTAPNINVYLENADTGSRNANIENSTRIKAKIVYEGCVEGSEYVLVMRLEDTSTSTVCMLPDGSSTVRQPFTAEGRAGVFEFEFEIGAGIFAGRILTENHYIEGMESENSGSSGKSRVCIYVPSVRTNALSKKGGKTVLAGKNTVICDIVSYDSLAPSEKYKLVTWLRDTESGEAICDSEGNPVLASSEFIPTESSGQIATKINADLREYGNRSITVLEEIYTVSSTGEPALLLSTQTSTDENSAVFAGLTEICVIDEMYAAPIPGVSLEVISMSDGSTFSGVSDENGKCSFPLDDDETQVCEIVSVPDEYNALTDTIKFTPSCDDEDASLSVSLLKKKTVVVKRLDSETLLPIQGLVTEVYDSNGNKLATITSNEEGKGYFDAEQYWNEAAEAAKTAGESSFAAEFTFKDSATPAEYYPIESSWTVSIDEGIAVTGTTELNSVKRVPITVTVVDNKGNSVPGVELTVIDGEGNIQGRAVSDHDGKIYITPKRTGQYALIENSVPSGYSRLIGRKQFAIGEDGQVSGNLTVTVYSEDFTSGVAAMAISTVLFLGAALSAVFIIKKKIKNKIKSGVKHSRRRSK